MVAKFLAHVARRNSCRFTPPLVYGNVAGYGLATEKTASNTCDISFKVYELQTVGVCVEDAGNHDPRFGLSIWLKNPR